VEMTARMNWYRMFERIQSVRVMGVVESFRMTPICRSSALTCIAPERLAVITDITMMPGTKNSMNRYFLVSIEVSADVMNGGFPDIPWFMTANTEFSSCIFVEAEFGLGVC